MRLLFDQNLSYKLCSRLADIFPGSAQARLLGLEQADDRAIWEYAREHGYTIVTQDADFGFLSVLLGPPPRVIWLRCGNASTPSIEALLRAHQNDIAALEASADTACLEVTSA